MRKSKTLTSLMCALCLTTSAYAVNIDQGSDLTVDAGSRDHIIAGNKLKMKNSLVGIMIGHDFGNGKFPNGNFHRGVQHSQRL